MNKIIKDNKMNVTIKNIGSYMVIERSETEESFGDDIYYGVVKYHNDKSKVECINRSGVTYFKKDVEGQITIDRKKYDIVLYYKIILNFIYREELKGIIADGNFRFGV